MMKHWALAAALLSLAVSISCSSAHSPTFPISVDVSSNFTTLFVGESDVQLTAKVSGSVNTAVTWSLQQNGTDCTNNPSVCGTLSSTTANPVNYTAPTTPQTVTVVATLQSNTANTGSVDLTVDAISVQVTPYNANIGSGLAQQFTAVVIPDHAPQAVTWSASCGGCIDANTGILTGPGSAGQVTVTATATGVSGKGSAPASIVSSRMPAGAYAFQVTGFDVNTRQPTAATGKFTINSSGNITGGIWDELLNGNPLPCTFSGGSFTPVSNNQGKLALTGLCNGSNRSPVYNVVFDAAGDIQMIEADATATGSGTIEPVTGTFNFTTPNSFVFGFAGVHAGNRAGYAGFLPMDGQGHIGQGGTPGLIDLNDGGTASSDSNVTGTYSVSNGVGSMTLNALGTTLHFDLFVVSGQTKVATPLTLFAISTDSNAAVTGTVVFQDPKLDTSNAGLNKLSVAALTGLDKAGNGGNGGSNVALSLVSPDKKGNIGGNFDQNDAGTIQSTSFSNTYCASSSGTACGSSTAGRYIINLLGNSSGSPTGLPFVLYLSAANAGFLLDQKSTSVMTGTMKSQVLPKDLVAFASSELASPFAAATTTCAISDANGVPPCAVVENLLLTWGPTGTCTATCVSGEEWNGTQNPSGAGTALAGTYSLSETGNGGTGSGSSSIVLTTPSNQTYVIYMLDVFDNSNPTTDTSHFLMIQVDKGVANASIINVQQ